MLYIKVKKIVALSLAAFILSSVLFATTSHAQMFGELMNAGSQIFSGMKGIIYFVAGFGVIGVAIGGFFGKINWRWLSAVIIGLIVISLTAGIINYMTEGDNFNVTNSIISGDGK